MAGGGLLQLIAYGPQSCYLRGDSASNISFWKTIYRRQTNFSLEQTLRSYNTNMRKYNNFEVLFDDKNNKYNDVNNILLNSIDLNNFNNNNFFLCALSGKCSPSEKLLIKEPKKEEKESNLDSSKLLSKQSQKSQRAAYNRQIKNQIKRR